MLPTLWMRFTSKVIVMNVYTHQTIFTQTQTHTPKPDWGPVLHPGSKVKNKPHFLWPVTSKKSLLFRSVIRTTKKTAPIQKPLQTTVYQMFIKNTDINRKKQSIGNSFKET